MTQFDLDFLAFCSPAPVRGRTPRAKHASFTGAQQAGKTWTKKRNQILAALRFGPCSRQRLRDLTGIQINAVCSLIESLVGQGEIKKTETYETVTWPDGSITRREQFQIRER